MAKRLELTVKVGDMTGANVGTKGIPRAEREQQILVAAAAEFGRHGYRGASVPAIAAQVGVSKPLIYGYFESKAGLYVACVEQCGAELVEAIEPVLAADLPALDLAEATLRAVFQVLDGRPHNWNVIFDRTIPDGEPRAAARRIGDLILSQGRQGVQQVLKNAGEVDELDSSMLTDTWASLVTVLVDWWIKHPEQTADGMIQRLRRLMSVVAAASMSEDPALS